MSRIIIFDGKNLLWRSHGVFQTLSAEMPNGDVIPTGGIYGFLSLAALKWRKYGGRALVAWEGTGNFRKKLFPDYKKKDKDPQREIMLDEIHQQEKRLMAVLRCMGVEQYKSVGGEADDVLATLARRHVDKNPGVNKAIIYTGDSDLRQMVGDGIVVIAPGFKGKDNEYVTAEDVVAKDLVPPNMMAEMKALAGDTSDNVPGIAGVGKVTAQKLLYAFDTLENTIRESKSEDNSNWPVSIRFKKAIAENEDNLMLYKKLTTVDQHIKLKRVKSKTDFRRLLAYLHLYRFASLINPLEFSSLRKMGVTK